MGEGDRGGAFTHRGRGALHVAAAHVADGEYTGQAGLQEMGRSRQRPARGCQILGREIGARLDEPLRVDGRKSYSKFRAVGVQPAEYPPSTKRIAPVTYDAASDARKTTGPTSSCSLARLRIGVRD